MLPSLRFGAVEMTRPPETDKKGLIRLEIKVTDGDQDRYPLLLAPEADTVALTCAPQDPMLPVRINKSPLLGKERRDQLDALLAAVDWPEGTEAVRQKVVDAVREVPFPERFLNEHAAQEQTIPAFEELPLPQKAAIVLLALPIMLLRTALNLLLLPFRLVGALLR